jgi:hypothetical protein
VYTQKNQDPVIVLKRLYQMTLQAADLLGKRFGQGKKVYGPKLFSEAFVVRTGVEVPSYL